MINQIPIVSSTNGNQSSNVDVPEWLINLTPNEHVVYLEVKSLLANARQGTHKTKQRSDVHGSTRKVVRQKGSGGARHGDRNSPIFIGGGRVFGPTPRDYSLKINRKEKMLAIASAFKDRLLSGVILAVDNFTVCNHKTKEFVRFVKKLNITIEGSLIVLDKSDRDAYLGGRNLAGVYIKSATSVNTLDILKAQTILFTKDSLNVFLERIRYVEI